MTRKWQGTTLFAVIMAGVSVTVAGRLLTGGGNLAGSAVVTPQSGATNAAPQPATGGSSASSPSTSAGAGASAGSTGAPSTGSASSTTTVTGDTEQTQFGPVQVALIFSGSKITKVQTLQAPMGGGRDQMLTSYAVPQLEQEVISSQSARVDTVSGATYTSEGYIASVQSAIDKHK